MTRALLLACLDSINIAQLHIGSNMSKLHFKRLFIISCAICAAITSTKSYAEFQEGGSGKEGQQAHLPQLEIDRLKSQLDSLEKEVQKLKSEKTILGNENSMSKTSGATENSSTPKATENMVDRITSDVLQAIQPRLAAGSQQSASQFNPAVSFAIDQVLSYSNKDDANYEFRSGEIGIAANVDPFTKGYAFINGTPDEVEVEEASVVTTSLPYNLSLQGGRFFANLNRLAKLHEHDLPTVQAPLVNEAFIGGEAQADGLELNYLLPTEHFINLVVGAYNKIGAENDRVLNSTSRKPNEFTYLGRVETSFDLDDSYIFDVNSSLAYTPAISAEENKGRSLFDLELTFRHSPLSSSNYQGIIWSTEMMYNDENRPIGGFPSPDDSGGGSDSSLQFERQGAFGMYSYAEVKLSRRWVPGFLFDYVEDIDGSGKTMTGYSPYLNCYLSEFQRLRAEYSHLEQMEGGSDDKFFLQWTVFLGSHVHGFKNR